MVLGVPFARLGMDRRTAEKFLGLSYNDFFSQKKLLPILSGEGGSVKTCSGNSSASLYSRFSNS